MSMDSSPVNRNPEPSPDSGAAAPEEAGSAVPGKEAQRSGDDRRDSPESKPKSPWLEFLSGRRKAKTFLGGLVKSKIPVPDRRTVDAFATMVAEKPTRLSKVLDLLQTSRQFGDTIQGIVAELAGAVSAAFELPVSDNAEGSAFRYTAEEWIERSNRRPLKKAHLEVLLIGIHAAGIRSDLQPDTAFALVRGAVTKAPGKRASKEEPRAPGDFLDVLLSATPTAPVLQSLVDSYGVNRAEAQAATRTVSELRERIEDLETQLGTSAEREETLATRVAALEQAVAEGEERRRSLEEELVTLEDGYKRKMSDLRGRIGGMLDGQLTRWLETALDASRSDPPWIAAVTERLEDALALIEKEKRWLQPSA